MRTGVDVAALSAATHPESPPIVGRGGPDGARGRPLTYTDARTPRPSNRNTIVGFFSSSKPQPEPEPVVEADPHAGPQKKTAPTPTRKAAEAARRERLNPTLSPKEAKARERASAASQRERSYQAVENRPERQLLRNVIDARFNIGEIAMPVLLAIVALSFIPAAAPLLPYAIYFTWAFVALMVLDTWIMWRKFKKLAAERLPSASKKGLAFYGFNRQLSFRRWRTPAPQVKRGEAV